MEVIYLECFFRSLWCVYVGSSGMNSPISYSQSGAEEEREVLSERWYR
jgi:hypothetical protein